MTIADRELADLAVARLLEQRFRDGGLPASQVRQVAETLGCSRATVYRWLAAGGRHEALRARFELDDVHLDAFVESAGSAAQAHRVLSQAGASLPSRRTFQRAVRRDLTAVERARARMGEEGERRMGIYVPRDEPARNRTWEADHKQLDILVRPTGGHRPVKPWLTSFLDTYSRAVMGYAVSLVPDRGVVLAALGASMRLDEARGPFAGRPGQVRCDRGLEFAAGAIREAAAAIGFELCFTPPYMPHRKGKIERLHRTIVSEFLTGLPFFTEGPRRADGTLILAPNADPMLLSDLVAALDDWINEYNLRRAHRGLDGQTPLERFTADATPIYQPEEAALRRLLLADEQRPVGEKGVAFFGGQYYAPELYALRGEVVEVRYMPNDKRRIEIYRDGAWVCTALPVATLSAEDKTRHVAQQRDAAERARRHERSARRAAKVRLASMTGPGQPEDTSVVWAGSDQLAAHRSKKADDADAELVRGLGLRAEKPHQRRETT